MHGSSTSNLHKPKVYILVRTHNRPKMFQQCINSIQQQVIKPEVIIISDDKNNEYINSVTLSHQIFRPQYKKSRWWIRHHNPFNDYFNQALKLIPNGHFICYLDDDDELVDPNWIKTILEKNQDVLVAQFKLGPSNNHAIIGDQIERGKIGSCCFAIRSEIAHEFRWPKKAAGDFFFIKQITNKYNPTFLPMIVAKVQKDLNKSWKSNGKDYNTAVS